MTDCPVIDSLDDQRELTILDLADDALSPIIDWAIDASIEALRVGPEIGYERYLTFLAGSLAGMEHRVRFAICPVIEFAWRVSAAGADAAAVCFADMFVDEFKKDTRVARPKTLRAMRATLSSQWALRLVLALRQGQAAEDEAAQVQPTADADDVKGDSDAVPE